MGDLAERKRQRRQYLGKKLDAYCTAGASGALFLFFISVTLLLVFLKLQVLWEFQTDVGNGITIAFLIGIMAFGTGLLCKFFGQRCLDEMEAASRFPYVPPIDTITLPAEEVLVRAAEPPAAPSEELLRAATGDAEESREELLRAAGSEKNGRSG